jgi:hypothetical protein
LLWPDALPFFFSAPSAVLLVALGLAFAPVVAFWRRWSTTFGPSAGGEASDGALGCGTVAVLVGAIAVPGAVVVAGVVDVVVESWGVVAPASGVPAAGVVAWMVVEPSVDTGGSAGAATATPAREPPKPAAVRPPPATAESIARQAQRRALTGDIR